MKATHSPRRSLRAAALAGLAAAAALVALAAACRPGARRPDVVLVTIDTLRADHCSMSGYPIATTPNLDALAAGGQRFATAYAESSTTAPSHAVLMTGRHFRTLGLTKNGGAIPEDAVTLAERLREEGYATAAFVSSFPVRARFGFAQGFEHFDDRLQMDSASVGRQKESGPAHDRRGAATMDAVLAWLDAREGRSGKARRPGAARAAGAAPPARDDRPLFLWVHLVDPHAPYHPPKPFRASWPQGTTSAQRRYDGEVHYADDQLGRLVHALDRREPHRERLVVVTSDHGEGLGDHGWMSHGVNLHEEAVRVPLVANWPGHLPADKVTQEAVGLVDVAPGILALLGIDAPTFAHGRRLFEAPEPDRAIFLQRRDYESAKDHGMPVAGSMTAVVQRGAKLVLAPQEGRRELYDLGADPREQRELLGNNPPRRAKRDQESAAQHMQRLPASPADEARASSLQQSLEGWATRFPAVAASEPPKDPESLKALRSLGYVQ